MPVITRGPRAVRPPGRPVLAVIITMSGRSFANIGRAVGCTGETISRVVAGTLKPSAALAQRIAALLDVTDVDALFAVDDHVRRLVDEAVAAGVVIDDDAADRLVGILSQGGRRDQSTA